jgi:hypothetical protein
MSLRYRQTVPIVNPDNPRAWGRDDITGLPVMHDDLVKQMEYIGNGLAWTGFMVHFNDADQPNPQLMPPRLRPDPVPVHNPRIFNMPNLPAIPQGLTATATTPTTITLIWDEVPKVPAYTVGWTSIHAQGEEINIPALTYTITNLTPGTRYLVSVASIGNNSTANTIQFTTSAFSNPIAITLPT